MQALWASRRREDWESLARELGFTDVLVYADWELQLPLRVRGPAYALYRAAP